MESTTAVNAKVWAEDDEAKANTPAAAATTNFRGDMISGGGLS
jgi:hypothetical protein